MKNQGMENLSDQFMETTALSLVESDDDKVVDGKNILARAAGQFFIVDGRSNNNRWYSRALWEKAIGESEALIDTGQMLGTIGHDQPINDKALLEGRVSHRVSKLWINEQGVGMGEVLVLNTDAGKQLNAYLRGGVQFPISSRAFGRFDGKGPDGSTPKIDENNYRLEGFDFVRIQGVPGAIPQLVESDVTTTVPKEEEHMEPKGEVTTKVLEELTQAKMQLDQQLREALDVNEKLKGDLAIATNRAEELNTQLGEYQKIGTPSDVTTQLAELEALKSANGEANEKLTILAQFEELGTFEDVKDRLEKAADMMSALESLGSPEEIQEALSQAAEFIKPYKELGTVEEITEAFDKMETFTAEVRELGSVDEIRETMQTLADYTDIGTVDEIRKILDVMEVYMELGTPEDIQEAFDLSDKVVEKLEAQREQANVAEVAEKLKISESLAGDMLKKLGRDGATDLVGRVAEELGTSVADRYRVGAQDTDLDEGNPDDDKSVLNESRASRLSDKLSS